MPDILFRAVVYTNKLRLDLSCPNISKKAKNLKENVIFNC